MDKAKNIEMLRTELNQAIINGDSKDNLLRITQMLDKCIKDYLADIPE